MMVKPGCGAFRTSGRRYLCSCLCRVGGDWAWCWRRRCIGGEETECTHQAWCRRRGAQLSRKQKEGSDHPWSRRHRGSWPAWADKNEQRRRCVHRPVRMKQWRRCSAGGNKTVAIEMERALVWLWTAVGGAGAEIYAGVSVGDCGPTERNEAGTREGRVLWSSTNYYIIITIIGKKFLYYLAVRKYGHYHYLKTLGNIWPNKTTHMYLKLWRCMWITIDNSKWKKSLHLVSRSILFSIRSNLLDRICIIIFNFN